MSSDTTVRQFNLKLSVVDHWEVTCVASSTDGLKWTQLDNLTPIFGDFHTKGIPNLVVHNQRLYMCITDNDGRIYFVRYLGLNQWEQPIAGESCLFRNQDGDPFEVIENNGRPTPVLLSIGALYMFPLDVHGVLHVSQEANGKWLYPVPVQGIDKQTDFSPSIVVRDKTIHLCLSDTDGWIWMYTADVPTQPDTPLTFVRRNQTALFNVSTFYNRPPAITLHNDRLFAIYMDSDGYLMTVNWDATSPIPQDKGSYMFDEPRVQVYYAPTFFKVLGTLYCCICEYTGLVYISKYDPSTNLWSRPEATPQPFGNKWVTYRCKTPHVTTYIESLRPFDNPDTWMSRVSGSKRLSELAIPGTHDSFTYTLHGIDAVFSKTQYADMDYMSQLDAGVRYFDLRLLIDGNDFQLRHGDVELGLTFSWAMSVTTDFLRTHPGEGLIFSIQDSGDPNPIEFANAFLNATNFYSPQSIWFIENRIPTLDEIRGKIVLLRRFHWPDSVFGPKPGIDGDNGWVNNQICTIPLGSTGDQLVVQDVYVVHLFREHSKWEVFSDLLNAQQGSSSSTTLYINFSSGSSLVETPATVADYMNPKVAEILNHKRHSPLVGVIVMDYITITLAGLVIEYNFD